jgi:hypothetical protein
MYCSPATMRWIPASYRATGRAVVGGVDADDLPLPERGDRLLHLLLRLVGLQSGVSQHAVRLRQVAVSRKVATGEEVRQAPSQQVIDRERLLRVRVPSRRHGGEHSLDRIERVAVRAQDHLPHVRAFLISYGSLTSGGIEARRPVLIVLPGLDLAGVDREQLGRGAGSVERAARGLELDLFGAHPPLPRPGFYAPADTPDPDAVLHALSHHWLVVKYRPGADVAGFKILARALAGRRVLVISGSDGMPFAVGALVCADVSAARDFARRHAAAL